MVSRHQKNFFLVFNTLICLLVIIFIIRGPASKHAVQKTETLPLVPPKIIITQTKEVKPETPVLPENPVTPELFE